jgi:phosphate transport system permease protein
MATRITKDAPTYRRNRSELAFQVLAIVAMSASLGVLAFLLLTIFESGLTRLNFDFLSGFPSRRAERAGIYPALLGSIYLMIVTACFAVPIGVGAAIYLEEYARESWVARLIEVNIANLAGVPSVIYGLLGLQIFVRVAGLGRSVLAGSLTLALLILPVIIVAAREALRAVPRTIHEAAFALGASKWQAIWHHVLPIALPGIMTGCILAFSRAVGETAPLITIGAMAYISFVPDGLYSEFTALPIQIYNWTSRPQVAFQENAAAAILVLLALLVLLNALAITIRYRFQRRWSM